MMDIETRLRAYFAGTRFRRSTTWENDALEGARLPSMRPTSDAGSWSFARLRRGLFIGVFAVLALAFAVSVLPTSAGGDAPAWVMGIRTAIHIDSTSQGYSTSWGTRVELIGAYVDEHRVIVIVQSTDKQLHLTDFNLTQGDHRITGLQTVAGGDGYVAMKFEPLPEALASTVPVTVHLADRSTLPSRLWTMNFSLGPRVGGLYAVPPSGQTGGVAITFNNVSVVPGAVAIQFTETGLAYDQVLGPVQYSDSGGAQVSGRGPITPHLQVLDGTGNPLPWLDLQLSPAADGSASVTFSEVFLRSGLGPYRLVVTGPQGTSLERSIGA